MSRVGGVQIVWNRAKQKLLIDPFIIRSAILNASEIHWIQQNMWRSELHLVTYCGPRLKTTMPDAFVLPSMLYFQPVANDPLHPVAVRSTPALWSFTGFMQFLKISIYTHLLLNLNMIIELINSNLDTRISLGSNFDLRSIIHFKPQGILSKVAQICCYTLHDFMNQLVEKNSCALIPTPQLSMFQTSSQCPAHVLPSTAAMGLGHSEGWAQAMLFAAWPQCLEDVW